MAVSVTVGLVCCGVGVVTLVAVVAVRAREWHRGTVSTAARHAASPAYACGLWCLPTGIGLISAGPLGGVVLGAAAAVALVVVVVPRSGIRFTDDDVWFGRDRVPLDAVATVVRSPKASFGRTFGTWGVADADGAWIAAFRPHAACHGASAVRALIGRAGLTPSSDGRTWTSPDAVAPSQPFPALAR